MRGYGLDTKAAIRRHPVGSYFTLAFFISWVGSFVAGGPKFLRGETLEFTDQMAMLLPMLAGPSVAGIALTIMSDGRSGLRELFSRMGKWRVGGRWYAALLVFPILILVVLLALDNLLSPAFSPVFFSMGIPGGLLAGFLEEIGWMGYAFPKMRLRRSTLAASLLLGVLHAIWHIVADYLGASAARGVYWLPHFLAMMVLAMSAMRVLLVWVYANTESLLLAQLMHASSTGFLIALVPLTLSPANDTLFYMVYGAGLWVAAAIVIARYGNALVHRRAQSKVQGARTDHRAP
jgi:membrane protease YdiL (CAAX protease family)